MSSQKKQKWYYKKIVYVPISIILGIFGFSPMFGSLLGVKYDEEFNPDYYKSKDEPLFRKKQH
ncbi:MULTISPECIES: hypothetical protein [Enterococcus]|uniref:Uncharacterized protein n=1 Tax=Candidatus Enterococcus ferrettii TaxID=2815324 RepID=A0ABV0EMX1_9ENTE|nr:hypothetical protein [Enterococcus sp. 665A]MBO1338498.1 hypothetical protein [Enterococcus sp. 665A]